MNNDFNLFLGYTVHQAELDSIASEIIAEYSRGNTNFIIDGFTTTLSEDDLEYIERKVREELIYYG